MAGSAVIALSASLAPFSSAAAKDLGVHGAVFDIIEPDLIAQIYARLRNMEAAGDIDRINREFAARARRHVERPAPVKGLRATEDERTWLYDPSITLSEDIRDYRGVLIHKAGTTVNPLDYQPFQQTLLFIDGDAPDQVAWAQAKAMDLALAQTILVNGAPLELMRQHETPFFFDQHGFLVGRFGIQQTPALVRQDGNALRVSEVRP